MRTIVLLVMSSVLCLVSVARGCQHNGSTLSVFLIPDQRSPSVANQNVSIVIGNVPRPAMLQRLVNIPPCPSKGELLQEQTIGSVPVISRVQVDSIRSITTPPSDPDMFAEWLKSRMSMSLDFPYTFDGFGQTDLIMAQGTWVTESLSEQTYTGVKRVGPMKEMEYTYLLTETIDKLNPLRLKPHGNDLHLEIDTSSFPEDIKDVQVRLCRTGWGQPVYLYQEQVDLCREEACNLVLRIPSDVHYYDLTLYMSNMEELFGKSYVYVYFGWMNEAAKLNTVLKATRPSTLFSLQIDLGELGQN